MEDVIDLSTDIIWTPIEMDADEESNEKKLKVKDVVDRPRTLSFCEKMTKLLPHCLPLKESIKDRSISYVDLLPLDPYPTRLDEDPVPRVSRRLTSRKSN